MSYKRILTVQDISCVGQCSLTVALPIISAMGVEASILPSSILSTHTYKFSGYTFLDLTDEMPKICAHWKNSGITFDGVYTGYIGNPKQFEVVKDIVANCSNEGVKVIVDPVMGDNGVFYTGFDKEYAKKMADFCSIADVILPNLTEACFLTGVEYKENYSREYIEDILKKLSTLGVNTVVLTGVSFEKEKLGVAIYDKTIDTVTYYFGEKIDKNFHGTGDIYSSCFVGGFIKGLSAEQAGALAVDYTIECIKQSYNDDDHWYGAEFEKGMPYLAKRLAELE